jgi:recombination protein U
MKKTNELEKRANKANLKYRKTKKALIQKVPTPILYTRKGLIAQQSTVDYTGILAPKGRGIAFDAKETKIKTSFPLANIHQHQLNFLELFEALGGVAFFLIHFKSIYDDKAFKTPVSLVKKYWDGDERKSIPFEDFKEE